MLNAIDERGLPVDPEPNLHAFCPGCKGRVTSKCGDIVIHHFAHLPGERRCEWEPESFWHRTWKTLVPRENREVVMEAKSPDGLERISDILPRVVASLPTEVQKRLSEIRRADIVAWDGMVVELQASSLAPAKIKEREAFYEKTPVPIHLAGDSQDYMSWLFDVEDPFQENRLIFRPGKNGPDDPYRTFTWKHARMHIAFTTAPTYLDLGRMAGPQSIFRMRKLHKWDPDDPDCRVGGYGFLIDRETFIEKVIWPKDFVRLPVPTGRNCPDHPTYPLVRKGLADFCRRGRHYPDQPERHPEQPRLVEQPEGCPICGVAWSATWPGRPRRCLRGHPA